MDDLLNSFAHQSIDPSTEPEEEYIHHFVDGSPAGSEHESRLHTAVTSNDDLFLHNEAFEIQAGTDSAIEDEANYNADVDEDEGEDDEHGRDETFHHEAYRDNLNPGASHNHKSFFKDDTNGLYPSIPSQDDEDNTRAAYGDVEQTTASSGDDQNRMDDFAKHLRQLHRQDMERDDLLTVRFSLSARSLLGFQIC